MIVDVQREAPRFRGDDAKEIKIPDPEVNFTNLSVRKVADGFQGFTRAINKKLSKVHKIKLDNDYNVVENKELEFDYKRMKGRHRVGIEDVRSFIYKGEEWGIGNSVIPHKVTEFVRMCIFKESDISNSFKYLQIPISVDKNYTQKNWSPFEYDGRLLCEYSLRPHVVVEIDVNDGSLLETWQTNNSGPNIVSNNAMRGGAPPVLLGNKYLGVGHIKYEYRHFFYVFESLPPFKILSISHYFKLDEAEKIQLVTGLSIVDDKVYLSYGVNDEFSRISVFDLESVYESLNLS